jgi:prepilin-type processing-associated H-X9-DG protein
MSLRLGRSSRAFTLVELLVVIASIAILLSLLLPALSRAKRTAHRITCINNHRQMALAWKMYSADNNDAFVLNGHNLLGDNRPYWVFGSHFRPATQLDTKYLVDPQYALFSVYIKEPRIYKCPSDPAKMRLVGRREQATIRSYAMNVFMGTASNSAAVLRRGFASYHNSVELRQPSERFLFIDINPWSVCNSAFFVTPGEPYFFMYPGYFHNHGAILSFADGHAEYHKWKDIRTERRKPAGTPQLAGLGVEIPHHQSSPNNPDLAWIQQRTTEPSRNGPVGR